MDLRHQKDVSARCCGHRHARHAIGVRTFMTPSGHKEGDIRSLSECMNDVRRAIIAATGTARKRVIPAVREGGLCTIAAIDGRDEAKLAALANQNWIA
jgi:hypothetical protein